MTCECWKPSTLSRATTSSLTGSVAGATDGQGHQQRCADGRGESVHDAIIRYTGPPRTRTPR